MKSKLSENTELLDKELMIRCQSGDTEAFSEIYNRYKTSVYSYILRNIGDRERSEDLMQETFLRVFRNRDSYKPTAKFSSWLYRIAHNLFIDEKRKYWSRMVDLETETQNEKNLPSIITNVTEKSQNSLDSLDDRNLMDKLREALNALSEEQREVMILNKFQGLSYGEISEILEISPESVKQRAYRAHTHLRKLLLPYVKDRVKTK